MSDDPIDPKSNGFTRNTMQSEDGKSFNLIDKRSLRIAKNGIGITTITSGTIAPDGLSQYATVTVPHNLGYIPTFMAFYKDGSGTPITTYSPVPDAYPVFQAQMGFGLIQVGNFQINGRADAINIYFDLMIYSFAFTYQPTYPYTIKYYIYTNQLT